MLRFVLLLITAGTICAQPVFRFQNNFWVNMHHFVRGEQWRRAHNQALEIPLESLSDEERGAWKRALDGYREMATQSLIAVPALVQLNNTLAISEPSAPEALLIAAPVYRAHRWDRDQRENAAWITPHEPEIQRHAVAMRRAIAAAFHVKAPREPILVDVAREVGPQLAYTTGGPVGYSGHSVIAPQKNADPMIAMDTIFHEISHTMDRAINDQLYSEAERLHLDPPQQLWHALTIYTTWKVTKRELRPKPGVPYTPDADADVRFERNGWEKLRVALDKDWQPYLDG
jgi:hypothetical protein